MAGKPEQKDYTKKTKPKLSIMVTDNGLGLSSMGVGDGWLDSGVADAGAGLDWGCTVSRQWRMASLHVPSVMSARLSGWW